MDYFENATSRTALLAAVQNSNMRRVKAALAAGANVNGSTEQPYTPVMVATAGDDVGMVSFFIDQGVDLDRSAHHDLPCPSTDEGIMPGERALHVAAKRGNVEIVRLLKRAGADLNATDTRGRTPLMAACACLKDCVAVVRVLLKLGANPSLADKNGYTPLHAIAQYGVTDLIDILYSGAPDTLSHYSNDGRTPLLVSCIDGHESMASRLLSLGATQRGRPHDPEMCPLVVAAAKGFEGVMQILIKEGMTAVRVDMSLPFLIFNAVETGHAKMLQLLLAADGRTRRRSWANITMGDNRGTRPLHLGASICSPACVNVLLAAGADEAVRDSQGRSPCDIIGMDFAIERVHMDREKEIAVRRMLEHGPAYRARSWAWPAAEVQGGGFGVGGAVAPSPPAAPNAPVSVRIFRQEDDRKLFASAVDRYCGKG